MRSNERALNKRKTISVKLTLGAIRKLHDTRSELREQELEATIESIVESMIEDLDMTRLRKQHEGRQPALRGRWAAKKRSPAKSR